MARQDAALLIVFVSDENDQSRIHVEDEYQFISWALNQRSQVFVASIVNLSNDLLSVIIMFLLGMLETDILMLLTILAVMLDICSSDWSSGVSQAAERCSRVYRSNTHSQIQTGICLY